MENNKETYPVVVLCGSTRFKDEFEKVSRELTLSGYIVISLSVYSHYDNLNLNKDQINMLTNIQYQKIDMADEIYVINKYGYMGSGTIKEIEYAKSKGKVIRYME